MSEYLENLLLGFSTNLPKGWIGVESMDDGAVLPFEDKNLVMTTDAYTVKPIFFKGGDIGSLSINGTLNDLAVMGAKPIAMTNTLIIEEGFELEDLERIIESMNFILDEENVLMIGGDTKVVPRGGIDGIMITTTGIGIAKKIIRDNTLRKGDKILISGSIGDHGIALLAEREGLSFSTDLESDCKCLWSIVKEIIKIGGITAMKDPTRGGLNMALNEMARKSKKDILIYEEKIPFKKSVKSACEMLGLDPLNIANEGKIVFSAEKKVANKILEKLHSLGQKDAKIIGEVQETEKGVVFLKTKIGGKRLMNPPTEDPIPRIC